MIEAGADLELQNNSGETALSRAKARENTEIVKLLIAAAAQG